MRVFIAGASGVIGVRLVRRLLESGHTVTATTTSAAKAPQLRALGAQTVVLDGLEARMVSQTVAAASPDAVVHQMTALAGTPDPKHFDRWFAKTNRLRTEGTDNLLAAAAAAGTAHFVAQSYSGWPNQRRGAWVKSEEDPLDDSPPAAQQQSLAAIKHLEKAVLEAPMIGTVLRYGALYGPGASDELVIQVRQRRFPLVGGGEGISSWLHIDDAVSATIAALERPTAGIFNIVDDEPAKVSEWLPYLAEVTGAKPPMRLPRWVGRLAAGEVVVSIMTQTRGSSNEKAKRELGWSPAWATWRDGFRYALSDATVASG